MAINRNVLAEKQATVLSEDGNTMYATIQMRHGKESEMDKSKFVPAEMGVATDTKKAFMAFGSNQVKEIMFREDSEIEELLGEVREISDKAVEAVESAEATAKQTIQDFTDQMKATIPEDYTETVKKVDILERNTASAIYKTASGESLQIEDSADAPLAGLKVYGKSRQMKTTGAQLAPINEAKSNDGIIVASNSDGSLNITGTPNKQYSRILNLLIELEPGNYYISGGLDDTGNMLFQLVVTDHENVVHYHSNRMLSIDGTETKIRCEIIYNSADLKALNLFNFKPMLNSGSTALPFEPYTGGQPSPSPDYPQEIEVPGSKGSVGVNVTGSANLLPPFLSDGSSNGVNFAMSKDGGYHISGTASVTTDMYMIGKPISSDNAWEESYYPEGIYIISCENIPNNLSLIFVIKDRSGEGSNIVINITSISTSQTINILDGDMVRAFFRANNGYNADVTLYPMLNEGSSALPWESYKHQSITIATPNGLPGIPVDSGGNYTDADGQQWVCDEVDFERGKYIQRINKIVYDDVSSIEWFKTEKNVERYYHNITPPAVYGHGLCNYFTYFQDAETVNKFTFNSYGNSCGFAFMPAGTGTSIEDWKSFLQQKNEEGNPLTVYYELATPVETNLSPEELAAYAALTTYYPTTNITTDSDPEAGIEAEYVADTKKYIDSKFAELAQNLAATQNTLLEV